MLPIGSGSPSTRWIIRPKKPWQRRLGVSGVVENRNKDYIRQRNNWKENRRRIRERKILESRWAKEQAVKNISHMVEVKDDGEIEKPA
jgi:hypothetical protein